MIKAGVIGHPIAHSKSPLIHGYWLKKFGIDGEYMAYDVPPDNLVAGVNRLVQAGLRGFNVTLPHKQTIMDLCSDISEDAQKIGAVNTVVIDDHGQLHGRNTDAFGFIQNLDETIPDFDWSNRETVVIGAGGAARAVLYALSIKGVQDITLTNRTQESANFLASGYGAKVTAWDQRQKAIQGSDLIINTTSLGMKGQPPLEIDLSGITDQAVVYDIVYAPLYTPLLCAARDQGAQFVTGIGMLLHQARPAFAAWFSQYPEVTPELEKLVL